MLVVVAAGNEGGTAWHYISAPADADSVMAVGAVNTSGVVGSFSSYGPSSDGQVKPAVAAVGVGAIVANAVTGQPVASNGTSFACPNMAGLTTCLWQAFPEVNNMSIITTLQQSANRAANPDDRTGYGIPDMKKAFVLLIKQLYSKQANINNCSTALQWNVKTDSAISIIVERKLATDADYIAVATKTSSGAFAARSFTHNEDLSAVTSTIIKYRFKMIIATDTSFYLDSVQLTFSPKPNFGADKNITRCSDSTVNLNSLFTTTGLSANWTLNGNTVANPGAVNTSGTYQLIASSASGCADTALAIVSFLAKPNLGADKIYNKCNDSSYNLLTAFNTAGLISRWTLAGNAVTNPSAVIASGVYQLTVTNVAGCSDTATVNINNDISLCPATSERIIISPNPASDKLTIVIVKNINAKIEIRIHDMWGQKMYSVSALQLAGAKTYTIPVKEMAAGIYAVSIWVNDKKEVVKKIMKR